MKKKVIFELVTYMAIGAVVGICILIISLVYCRMAGNLEIVWR